MTFGKTLKRAILGALTGAMVLSTMAINTKVSHALEIASTSAVFAVAEDIGPRYEVVTGNDRLNIRTGPGIEYSIVGKYQNGTVVTVDQESYGWVRTEKGWIHMGFLRATNAEETRESIAEPISVSVPVNLNLSITQPSGMSLDQVNKVIAGTGFAGNGEDILRCEQEYGVNAFFMIAIAKLESANGHYPKAKARNNMFGMMGKNGLRTYSSISENIEAFSKNMRNNYFNQGRLSIQSVNKKYCPPTMTWSGKVEAIMYSDLAKARS